MARQLAHHTAIFGALLVLHGCAAPPAPVVPETPDFASALQSVANADSAAVVISPPAPCCDQQTLPDFLGITCLYQSAWACFDTLRNYAGMIYPGLEAVPPVLAITDPANLSEDAPPAVKAAAEIKTQEDQAAQKIKALRYLATIGCGGCYPDVEDALISGMEDCTEAVRFEAVLAVRATTGSPCVFCNQGACCTEKIQNKLRELAFDKAGECCGGEPSPRVRRQARLALAQCGPPVIYVEPEEPEPADLPSEGPTEGAEGDDTEGPAEGDAGAVDPIASGTGPSATPDSAAVSPPHSRSPELKLIGARPVKLPPPVR